MEPTEVRLNIPETLDAALVLGPSDSILRRVDEALPVLLHVRGHDIVIKGDPSEVERATVVFSRLIALAASGETPQLEDAELLLEQVGQGIVGGLPSTDAILVSRRGRAIRPKTQGQARYVASMRENAITFGLGPAGTGKTYLAMAMAMSALRRHEVSRLVLTRPVVEAGESLGFLPGTLEEKLDPYVRPLYDALFDMCEIERATALIEEGVIEIAPLAFMRGRTLSDAFVILDEAQNTSPDQMKMFLTRMGFASRFVVTGDPTQRDLTGAGGIESARSILEGIEGISFIDLGRADIVRHALVSRIVEAYEGRRPERS